MPYSCLILLFKTTVIYHQFSLDLFGWVISHAADGHDLSGVALLNINVSPRPVFIALAFIAEYICSDLKVRCPPKQSQIWTDRTLFILSNELQYIKTSFFSCALKRTLERTKQSWSGTISHELGYHFNLVGYILTVQCQTDNCIY